MIEEKRREYIINEDQLQLIVMYAKWSDTRMKALEAIRSRPYDIDAIKAAERTSLLKEIRTDWIPRIAKMDDEGIRMIYALVLEGEISSAIEKLSCDSQDGG